MILINRAFFLILLLSPLWLFGQYSNIIHYTVKDGLPSSTTYCTVQDKKGFIYIGTDAGLVRYDGTNFKVYTTADGLPDNEVLGLHFDYQTDRIWVITYCKHPCYYRNGKFYTAENDSSLKLIKCDIGEFINGNIEEGLGEFLYNGSAIYECAGNKVVKKTLRRRKSPVLQVHKWRDSTYDILADSEFVQYHKGVITQIYPYHKHSEWCKWFDSLFVRGFYNEVVINGRNDIDNIQHLEFYNKTISGDYKKLWNFDLPMGKNVSEIVLSKDKFIISIWGDGLYTVDKNFKNAHKKNMVRQR